MWFRWSDWQHAHPNNNKTAHNKTWVWWKGCLCCGSFNPQINGIDTQNLNWFSMYAQYMNYIPESARRISINNQVYQCNIIKWNCVRSKLEAMTKKNTRDSTTTEEFVRKSGDNWKKNTRGTEKREKTVCVFFLFHALFSIAQIDRAVCFFTLSLIHFFCIKNKCGGYICDCMG